MAEGKTLHMDLGKGDLANRIITVGAESRAAKIAANFDQDKEVKKFHSSRGFTTFTGYFEGVQVSVVAIGMGVSMMDFFVRESRAIVDGPMIMVRYGTCGGLCDAAVPGSVVVSSLGAGYVARNPDHFLQTNAEARYGKDPYFYFDPAPADAALSSALEGSLRDAMATVEGAGTVLAGMNITADSFYSSQGRLDDRFHDDNQDLFDRVRAHYPNASSMEMETFTLLHLAQCSRIPIRAAAAAMVVANRRSCVVIHEDVVDKMEIAGGRAVLRTVAHVSM
jgi:uridine phosphorylase